MNNYETLLAEYDGTLTIAEEKNDKFGIVLRRIHLD